MTKTFETGGTAMSIKSPSPAIRRLAVEWKAMGLKTVLDYGAGHGRNSAYLRSLGFHVYSFDPYNGNENVDGWEEVSDSFYDLTDTVYLEKFDVVFTSFVLNVLPADATKVLLQTLKTMGQHVYHIVRSDLDIPFGKNKNTPENTDWFKIASDTNGDLSESQKMELGFFTSKGFQRLVILDSKYYKTIQATSAFRVYMLTYNNVKQSGA